MKRYLTLDPNGGRGLVVSDGNFSIGVVKSIEIVGDIDDENFDCYSLDTGLPDLNLFKEKWKKKIRELRTPFLEQLDYQYQTESENIYKGNQFKRTATMDEIFRKKGVLRDLPQQIDSLTTIDDVKNFPLNFSLDNI